MNKTPSSDLVASLPAPTFRAHDGPRPAPGRTLGINIGAETVKVVELERQPDQSLRWTRRLCLEHEKKPVECLRRVFEKWGWTGIESAAVSGRLASLVNLPQIPLQQAQSRGARFLLGTQPVTLVSIGSHGFSVLERRADGTEIFRENSRCSQGTGNFLRQLVGRFSLTIDEAAKCCRDVDDPIALSGRCPVILKTDMTHLANKGENRIRILAGLFDAVCENVLTLIKPGLCPELVVLIGGVSRAPRLRRTFERRLHELRLNLRPADSDDALYFEALGSALIAADTPAPLPSPANLFASPKCQDFDRLPALSASLKRVRRLTAPPLHNQPTPATTPLIAGLDIGSTGAKAVVIDATTREPVWESYRSTLGDPIGAAQALLAELAERHGLGTRIVAAGVTGSGRDIVGSLLTVCYGRDAVYILNEIAAHAEGALHYDPRVDTIFEIGGQDAKYIRLADGRIVDCAMNEACSAGTGSFIEEQGKKFAGVRDIAHLGREALAAGEGVSLGQHCSVFMAEVIDHAVAADVPSPVIIAGLYDSIIQNYLNRVKGSRTVGRVIFCQGMPFASDALAAAVARQTGAEVVVPPNPGTIGALGIALLAQRELPWTARPAIDLARFARACIERKDTFQCRSTTGCGGAGNRCRIERLFTVVEGEKRTFSWGGGCAIHERGTRKKKLPDRAPDPFAERAGAAASLVASLGRPSETARRIALTDEFALKGHLPFFAAFFHHLGYAPVVADRATPTDLKRGIQEANVSFCAPMQLYHGVASRLLDTGSDCLFLPMLCSLPSSGGEPHAVTCPIVQASADLLRSDLGSRATTVISPVIRFGIEGCRSELFRQSCRDLASELGAVDRFVPAFEAAVRLQTQFEQTCKQIGERALAYCREQGLPPVVVLGRPYTLHNTVLNSNVPALLREQGAIGIPLDCFPIASETPNFADMYWGQGQRILRAAHQIRRAPGLYSVYCSNYSCGPDSFNLHFFSHIMQGKPFAVIETDGHSGDAGTKTRLEAFLHCVEQDLRANSSDKKAVPGDFRNVQTQTIGLADILSRRETLLIPWMGRGSEVLAAGFRGLHIPAESLPEPDRSALTTGRRHTSGKECLPAALTLGALLDRLDRAAPSEHFAYVMPSTCGPCRFGVYNLLNQIVLSRENRASQVRIWSPCDTAYFDDLPPGFALLVFAGFLASDLLLKACYDTLPVETAPGAARAVYERRMAALLHLLEQGADASRSTPAALWQAVSGRLFGIRNLVTEAAGEFRAIRGAQAVPTVLVVGEIYVRSVPFANDRIIEKLQHHGVRAHLAPLHEWLDYCDHLSRRTAPVLDLGRRLGNRIQDRIRQVLHDAMGRPLGWPQPESPARLLRAARPYLRDALEGEAVLTLGGPLLEWQAGHLDGVVSVGPHECMPNKIAESQFFHLAEDHGLPSVTFSLNGEPLDAERLAGFVFDVKARFRAKQQLENSSKNRRHPAPQPEVPAPDLIPAGEDK